MNYVNSDKLLPEHRRLFPSLLLCALALSVPLPATAQQAPAPTTVAVAGGGADIVPDGRQHTWIEIDQSAGVIRFITGGQEQAVLDADGLHVRGDITYGGVIADEGAGGFADRTGREDNQSERERDHER